jgi:hypothetical protein
MNTQALVFVIALAIFSTNVAAERKSTLGDDASEKSADNANITLTNIFDYDDHYGATAVIAHNKKLGDTQHYFCETSKTASKQQTLQYENTER